MSHRCALALLLCLAVAGCREAPRPLPGFEHANVVIVLIDTLRRDRLGAHGYERPTSPHFDALARESVLFDQAQTPAPWTLPAIVSAFTSTWPNEHGVLASGQRIGPELVPLAERMRRLGYRTAAFIANPYAGRASGLDVGYETVTSSELVVDREAVARWLDEPDGRPFLLYLHSLETHHPYAAPSPFYSRLGQSPPGDRDALVAESRRYVDLVEAAGGRDRARAQRARAEQPEVLRRLAARRNDLDLIYDACVVWADENLGAIVELLRARGLLERTLLVVTADHGEEIFDHGRLMHGQSVYGELIRVPFLIRLPGGVAGGARIAAPVTLVDLVPTLLDLLGEPSDPAWRGQSLRALMERAVVERAPPRVISVRMERERDWGPPDRGRINIAVTQDPWKGIWSPEVDGFELYRLDEDRYEQNDRSGAEPEIVARLRSAARSWFLAHPDRGWAAPARPSETLTPEERARLRALGYLE